MLSFLAPWYLVAALAAAAGLVAAHFIVRRQPRALLLPTARFVPDAPVLTTGWARVPADLATLALRVLCVLLAGLALAGPFLQPRGKGTSRVILVDRSRAVADSAEVSDSLEASRTPGDVVIEYGAEPLVRGSLSAGLVSAVRAASRLRDRADSVELVIVSSFATETMDAATARVRREWPGRAKLVRVSAPAAPEARRAPALATGTGDPLAVALDVARPLTNAEVRVVGGAIAGADSLWVAEAPGRVLVHWPRASAPAGFIARARTVPVGGFVTAEHAVVALFQRRWQYVPALDSRPVAWWIDGDVAAAETALGSGCVRSVAVPVSAGGDFVLRPDFHAALGGLVQPCGGTPRYEPVPPASLAMLAGAGGLASAGSFAQPRRNGSPVAKWLLLASLACALLELFVRRRRAPETAAARGTGGEVAVRKVA